MKGDKYINLQKWLENNSNERITLTFSEVEKILGFKLPNSATTHTAWWENDSNHSQAVWLNAGYKTVDFSDAVSAKRITFERYSHSPKKKDNQCEDCVKGMDKTDSETTNTLGKTLNDCLENELGCENMDLNDVVFKPWRNGTEYNSTGYGLCVSEEHAQLFPKEWVQVVVEVVYQGESEILDFNLHPIFWTTCPDIKNVRMREWLNRAGITWNGEKPEFETVYLGGNKFRIILG